MKQLVIVVERRKPQTAEEAKLHGLCITHGQIMSRVFLHSGRPGHTRADTFFHEIAHAYMHWTGKKKGAAAEKVALRVGQAAAKAYRGPK